MNFAEAFRGIVIVLWLVVAGLIALAVMRASRGKPIKATSTSIVVMSVIALLFTSASAGLVFIEPEERGVVISALAPKGVREQALDPGLRWVVPFMERVERYPISRRAYTMSSLVGEGEIQSDDSVTARTSDGQEVFLDASVIFQVDPSQVVTVHIDWQKRYVEELVRPLARGIVRDAVSQFGVEEVYSSRRLDMTNQIATTMRQKFQENGLIMVDFVLRNITFSPEYAASVEQKQISEQQAQQAKFVVEQRRQEAEQARQVAEGSADAAVIEAQGRADARIIEAEAEKKALQAIAEALQENPDLLTYQYITKIAPGVQVMLVPNDAPYLLPLPTLESQVGLPAEPGAPTAPAAQSAPEATQTP